MMDYENYETIMKLKMQHPNIFNAVMDTNDGNGVFDEKKISGGANVIARDTDTIIDFPKNIAMVMKHIKDMTIESGIEIPFYLVGYKNGDEIAISRVIMPQDGSLYKAVNACDHNWIVPFLKGETNSITPHSLQRGNAELVIMQCHTHPLDRSGTLHSNNWAVGDLTSLRVLQENGFPVTHALLYTPEKGIKILESDFKNKRTIKNVEAQINVSTRHFFE